MSPTRDDDIRVTIRRRIRPLRLGFVVDPQEPEGVKRAFEMNTFVWGGALNPVIPLYSEPPKAWPPRGRGRTRPSPVEAAKGYLRAFEPDYLVEMKPGLAKALFFPDHLVLDVRDIAYNNGQIGMSVLQVLEHEYTSRFQFVMKQPVNTALRVFEGMDLLSAATFGSYGSEDALAKRHFEQAFDPAVETIDRTAFWRALGDTKLSPLSAGMFQIKRDLQYAFTLFFCDPASVQDALDFWNLRALGWDIFPLPQEWATTEDVLQLVTASRGPNAGVTVMRSFGAAAAAWRKIAGPLSGTADLKLFPAMPSMWNPRAFPHDGTWRLDAWSGEDETEITSRDGSLRFGTLAPHFLTSAVEHGRERWANDIELTHFSEGDRTATFPRLRDVAELLARRDRRDVRQTSSGLTTYARHPHERKYWDLPTSFEVVQSWARDRGYEVKLSGAGRIAMHLVRTLGGLSNVSLVKSVRLIDFINHLSHTEIEVTGEEPTERRVRVGTVSRQELIAILRKYVDGWGRQNSAESAERHLSMLLEQSVFRVGINVKCDRCLQRNWYALDDLSENLRCERCLQIFRFPASSPATAEWKYRPIGPFATHNYAQGAYGAVLAVHFLLGGYGRLYSLWCPAFEISRSGQTLMECDFAVFTSKQHLSDDLAFAAGEAKSGKRQFEAKDFSTCRAFLQAFPEASFVFATTRENLSMAEKRGIRALVRSHRPKRGAAGSSIIVLCRRELESRSAPVAGWPEDLSKEYRNDHASTEFQRLATVTQRLYLGE